MKLISWNVNGLRAVVGKGFTDIFNDRMRMFSVFRRRNSRPDRLIWRCRGMNSTGIMQKKRLFRYGCVHPDQTGECDLWAGH